MKRASVYVIAKLDPKGPSRTTADPVAPILRDGGAAAVPRVAASKTRSCESHEPNAAADAKSARPALKRRPSSVLLTFTNGVRSPSASSRACGERKPSPYPPTRCTPRPVATSIIPLFPRLNPCDVRSTPSFLTRSWTA